MKSFNTNTLAKPTLPPVAQFSGADREILLEELKEKYSTHEHMTENGKTGTYRTSINYEVKKMLSRIESIKYFEKKRPIATLKRIQSFKGKEQLHVEYAKDIPLLFMRQLTTIFVSAHSCNYKMGIELQAFTDSFSELSKEEQYTLHDFALINQCYTSEQAQAYVSALIKFQKLFSARMESVSIRKKLSNRASNRRRSKERCVQLIETLLEICSRILVVRVDLGLIRDRAKLQELATSPDFAQAEHDSEFIQESFNRFYEASKHNQLKHALGYILRIEHTPTKGFHGHLYYFFNANDHREDITWGQYIAEKWKIATNNLGSAFICNMKKDEYRYCALGVLEYTDHEMLENLKATFDYICKNDQYFAFTIGERIRSFRTSQIPKVPTTKLGRPRKFEQLSLLDSDQSNDAQVGGQ
ncbi:YagK/YfjJ domain-containing protein [Acinetobacter pittii]|uniref:YagK/YfjJ domain-containing protein n=1 Tax=Acinetobacter pittii TaxID=48296 RepID=UPI0019346A4F|nr:inovirus-type Gp2 protein [Acinetobacter pittii]QRF09457.1 inovirus-type Gp2 protein [Acinetobacter pittii]